MEKSSSLGSCIPTCSFSWHSAGRYCACCQGRRTIIPQRLVDLWEFQANLTHKSWFQEPELHKETLSQKSKRKKKNSRHAHWYNSGCKRESNQPLLILFKSPYTKWNPYLLLKEFTVIMLLNRNSIKLSPNDLLFYLYINTPINSHCRNVCL